jgi:hypothetical protein
MGVKKQTLIVREFQRHELVLPASISVAPEHQTAVRFSPALCERDGWVSATLTDFSPGGVGLMVPLYLPRACLIRVRVKSPRGSKPEHVLDVTVRVQRIRMTDRRPGFLVGTSYAGVTDGQREAIENLATFLEGPAAA